VSLKIFEQIAGALLVLFVLADVFLTVLYARIGTGIISDRVARWTWGMFREVSKLAGARRGSVLSFCGPTILVLLLVVWLAGLTCGTALVIHPDLGSSILMTNGPTPTDFATAVYLSGTAISTVGPANFAPMSSPMRLFFFGNSLVGISVLTLGITYLLQIFSALRERNTLGLKLHVLTRQTGDAAQLLAGLGPDGDFQTGYTLLMETAAEMTALKEAHHFYPVLFYFRFRQPFYSVSHNARVVLDLVTLIWTAIDQKRYRWLAKSAAVSQLHDSAVLIMQILEEAFVPGGKPAPDEGVEGSEVKDAWEAHYLTSLKRLHAAGIAIATDPDVGAQRYYDIRRRWEPYVTKLGRSGAFVAHETDPSTTPPPPPQEGEVEQDAHIGL
jgi:hypothetical protein